MKLIQVIISIMLMMLFLNTGAQEAITKPTFYFDEDLNKIDVVDFNIKKLKSIYKEEIFIKDSVIIKKLKKVIYFHSFNNSEFSQVKLLLTKYLNIEGFDKNIILIYSDSLLGHTEYNNSEAHKKSFDNSGDISEQEYLSLRKKNDKRQKKCKKFANKNNAIPIYVFSENINFTFKPKYHKKHKITNAIKSIFFNDIKNGHIIIKPNGQYFFYNYLTQGQVKKMLESDWKIMIKDFNTTVTNPNKYSPYFIDKMHKDERILMQQKSINSIKERQRNNSKKYGKKSNTKITLTRPNCYTYVSY